MSNWLIDPTTRVLTGALDGLSRRELTIASNISNIDTPGFKPSRVDFEAELAAAVAEGIDGPGGALTPPPAGQSASLGMARTTGAHLAGSDASLTAGGTAAGAGLATVTGVRPDVTSRVDGNAVDIDAQMIALSETQLKYSATSRMLTGKLQMLKDVVQSR